MVPSLVAQALRATTAHSTGAKAEASLSIVQRMVGLPVPGVLLQYLFYNQTDAQRTVTQLQALRASVLMDGGQTDLVKVFECYETYAPPLPPPQQRMVDEAKTKASEGIPEEEKIAEIDQRLKFARMYVRGEMRGDEGIWTLFGGLDQYNHLPILDLKGKWRKWFDTRAVAAGDLTSPIMRGTDCTGRAFVAFNYEKRKPPTPLWKRVFQRSSPPSTVVCHKLFRMTTETDEWQTHIHPNNRETKKIATPWTGGFFKSMPQYAEFLQLISGTHPTLTLVTMLPPQQETDQ